MKFAKKRIGRRVKAYELGGGSAVEAELIRAGKIELNADGRYSVFAKEAINGSGEVAERGDFFKIDSDGYPYPNKRDWFLENHRHIEGDEYEQIPKELLIWRAGDGISAELEFLFRTDKIRLNTASNERYFNAYTWGSHLSAAKDAVIVFYGVERSEDGEIVDVDFALVDREIFERDYEIVKSR